MTSIKFRALTHNDHKLFFEALGEHGKDFQNIQQYMTQKCGKSNSKATDQNKSSDPQEKKDQDKKDDDKKREQIRNFYNKLYGKLSQLVGKLDDRVEKSHQELYLLINYGEIWKKHGFKFNNKTKKLLEELIHYGTTTFRFKSKNVRLKTPSCKALKKINKIGVDEKEKVLTTRELPKDVIVEFHPSTNKDWLKVQSISQNPRVRARLSIQKRLCNILEYLESKWNVSHDKLNRTVDTWLKVTPNNQTIDDLQQQCPNIDIGNSITGNNITLKSDGINTNNIGSTSDHTLSIASTFDIHARLRLKPSARHELNEVNITRVVPDNHLDLSLKAYISRLDESSPKNSEALGNKNSNCKDAPGTSTNLMHNLPFDGPNVSENFDHSQGAMSTSSRLPVSLTTPDCSILFEKSSTSDQPSIAQARRHLNFLQSIAGSFEGCENSRTACEDTQGSLLGPPQSDNVRSSNFNSTNVVSFSNIEPNHGSLKTISVSSSNIPSALFDEDAAIDTTLAIQTTQAQLCPQIALSQHNADSQNSRSEDFNIPKNLTLGDWFKSQGGDDDANDAFSLDQKANTTCDDAGNNIENVTDKKELESGCRKVKFDTVNGNSSKPHNHMIEIKKLAEGWTRQDESSMTIGELYLAFNCPDKIVLEYEFESFTHNISQVPESSNQNNCTEKPSSETDPSANGLVTIPEQPSNNLLIFKLLTVASLSLTQIERQKQEQQHKLSEHPGSKLKRRKGPSNPNTIKYLKRDDALSAPNSLFKPTSGQQIGSDGSHNNISSNQHQLDNNNYIAATNQRVEEALKQLQPTRLSVYRRAR